MIRRRPDPSAEQPCLLGQPPLRDSFSEGLVDWNRGDVKKPGAVCEVVLEEGALLVGTREQ
jgi:hypothetical protein